MEVLVATGGSSHSEVALKFCALLLTHTLESLMILTVIKHNDDQTHAETILKQAVQLVDGATSRVHTKIRLGHPAEEIIREAEEKAYGLLVVGEKQHHSLVTRFILGSTAERVVEHAPCPVIIAKGKISPIRKVLLCDSGIEKPALADRFISQLGALLQGDKEVTILHVMSQMGAGPGVAGAQLRASAEELIQDQSLEGQILERDIQLLEQLPIRLQPKVRHGLVVDEILAEARDSDYDLVVIGAHRGEAWRRILLDDLAHQLIVKMDRPIAVVR